MLQIDLTGRVALVTGAGGGIGAELAAGLVDAGADVAVVDIDGERAAATVARLGRSAWPLAADVRDPEAVAAMVEAVVARRGRLDIAVNNVGMMGGRRAAALLDTAAVDLAAVVERNLLATILCCQAEARAMVAAGGGAILNITSGEASRPAPTLAAYGAAKAGIDHLTRTLAVELGAFAIRVNALAPGTTYTPEVAAVIPPDRFAELAARIPLGRTCTVDELVPMATFLVSDLARAITGEVISADNGARLGSLPTGARPTSTMEFR